MVTSTVLVARPHPSPCVHPSPLRPDSPFSGPGPPEPPRWAWPRRRRPRSRSPRARARGSRRACGRRGRRTAPGRGEVGGRGGNRRARGAVAGARGRRRQVRSRGRRATRTAQGEIRDRSVDARLGPFDPSVCGGIRVRSPGRGLLALVHRLVHVARGRRDAVHAANARNKVPSPAASDFAQKPCSEPQQRGRVGAVRPSRLQIPRRCSED